jgi:hypothetical protein
MSDAQPLTVIIVEKTGTLKSLAIKDFKEEELFKKCGFKKADGFNKQTEWKLKIDGKKYIVYAYGKEDGRANSENKYDFPPPIDTKLFFSSCALVAQIVNDKGDKVYTDLSLVLWNKMYEKLFGGFEDLTATALEDEAEEDELANVPKEKKTKQGYLKDGFVVDSSETEDSEYHTEDEETDDIVNKDDDDTSNDHDLVIEDIGSELSQEEYI